MSDFVRVGIGSCGRRGLERAVDVIALDLVIVLGFGPRVHWDDGGGTVG